MVGPRIRFAPARESVIGYRPSLMVGLLTRFALEKEGMIC